jgi:hypothetical protein
MTANRGYRIADAGRVRKFGARDFAPTDSV